MRENYRSIRCFIGLQTCAVLNLQHIPSYVPKTLTQKPNTKRRSIVRSGSRTHRDQGSQRLPFELGCSRYLPSWKREVCRALYTYSYYTPRAQLCLRFLSTCFFRFSLPRLFLPPNRNILLSIPTKIITMIRHSR